ncbi:hypothetical protein MKW92_031435 [Papaver armeniacum]|nr:hypothetical protein MKW92_031435 [Papaver armeniacum]
MSPSTTQLVVALSLLCLLLLGFSYSAEATARPITDDAGAALNGQCDVNRGSCANNDECNRKCQPLGCGEGICFRPLASSNREKKIDVNLFKVDPPLVGCYCIRRLPS